MLKNWKNINRTKYYLKTHLIVVPNVGILCLLKIAIIFQILKHFALREAAAVAAFYRGQFTIGNTGVCTMY